MARLRQFAAIAASASGDNVVVAAVPGRRIRVLAVWLSANGTVNAKFQSDTTDLTGLAYLVANNQLVLQENDKGWFQTAVGEKLDLNLSAAIAVGGSVAYMLI